MKEEAGCRIFEAALTKGLLQRLIFLSEKWEAEGSCYGYRANTLEDFEGRRIFVAEKNGQIAGYLFGMIFGAKNIRSIVPEGKPCFEVEELYVEPWERSKGIGAALFRFAEETVRGQADNMILSTAAKNWKAVLHFYLDELGMEFWSARLYKRI